MKIAAHLRRRSCSNLLSNNLSQRETNNSQISAGLLRVPSKREILDSRKNFCCFEQVIENGEQ